MTIYLFNLPHLRSDKNNFILFTDTAQRDAWVTHMISDPMTMTFDVRQIENYWKLHTSTTIHSIYTSNEPISNLNYLYFDKDGEEYFYFIDRFTQQSANSTRIDLTLDVFTTYTVKPSDLFKKPRISFLETPQLVLREHKDRFTQTGRHPIYDPYIEDIEVKAEKVSLVHTQTTAAGRDCGRIRLVLRQETVGTNVHYRWFLYTEIPISFVISGTTHTTMNFNLIDRSDVVNARIIELPYLPAQNPLVNASGKLYYDNNVELGFQTNINSSNIPKHSFTKNGLDISMVNGNDPKIYTSQFQPLFISWYDQNFPYKYENTTTYTVPSDLIGINILGRYGGSSKNIIQWTLNQQYYNFENIMDDVKTIQLNNDLDVMSSDLDTYNRYLIEDDERALRWQQHRGQINTMFSVTSQGIAAVPTNLLESLSPTAWAVRGTQAAIGISSTIMNEVYDHKERDLAHKQKLTQMAIGNINVSGSTPDLNHPKNIDKVKLYHYTLKPFEVQYLTKYFHDMGYKTLEYKIPTLKTRKYFNYIKMAVDHVEYNNVDLEVLEDLKDRLSKGIFFYHIYGTFQVDFLRSKENWEVWM